MRMRMQVRVIDLSHHGLHIIRAIEASLRLTLIKLEMPLHR
jgi:hypothetical protein